jgi:aldose 1-epimerase
VNLPSASFGKTAAGKETQLITLTSGPITVKLTDYGARIVEVHTPDKSGKSANICLGYADAHGYESTKGYLGCIVGRFGNRIANAKFTLNGKEYQLAANNGPNCLHGGLVGFDQKIWDVAATMGGDSPSVTFTCTSPDGEENFPGTLQVTVKYTLGADRTLRIDYSATTDKATVVNMTNHAYWNLGGVGSGDILGTVLTLSADEYLPIDATSIPTGKPAPVKGTMMDFTTAHRIGDRIDELKKEPHQTKGYDHCYVLRNQAGSKSPPALAARAKDTATGRVLEVLTTEPAIQLYCGNFLTGTAETGNYKQHAGFCLETQHYPDSPNQPSFPSTVLRPGETLESTTIHKFSVE